MSHSGRPLQIGLDSWGISAYLKLIIQKNIMPLKFLGKLMFPRLAPWQRKKQTRIMLWVILIAAIFGATVVLVMFFVNSKR